MNDWVLVGRNNKVIPLSNKNEYVVGRKENCDIIIESKSVDPCHALLCYNEKDQIFSIKDLNTTFGTFINNVKIREQATHKLHNFDSLRFGFSPYSLKIFKQMDSNNKVESETTSSRNDETVESRAVHDSPKECASRSCTAFTIALDSDENEGNGFNLHVPLRKFAPPKPDLIEKKTSKMRDKEYPSSPKIKTKGREDKADNCKNKESSHVSDTASYLIQRMLNESDLFSVSSNEKKEDAYRKSNADNSKSMTKSPSTGEKDSGVCDDKSESGTYTVDKNDPDVEEARRKIDHVFGVIDESSPQFMSSISTLKGMWDTGRNEISNKINSNEKSIYRSSPKGGRLSPKVDKKSDFRKEKKANQSKHKGYENRLYHSDLEMNKYEDDSSIKSDGGSTGSGGSGRCASDSNPSMRFNRAFALRRAKLGMDTLGVPINYTKDRQATISARNTPSPSFNRSDGGRYSLRLSNISSSQKPPICDRSRNSSREDLSRTESRARASTFSSDSEHGPRSLGSRTSIRSSFKEQAPDSSKASSRIFKTPVQCNKRTLSTRPYQSFTDNTFKNRRGYSDRGITDLSSQCSGFDTRQDVQATSNTEKKIGKELSALDGIVISAIHQLSHKLRYSLRRILEDEKKRHPVGSEVILMINELLPQVSVDQRKPEDMEISINLSNTLKNMRKIDQTLEVVDLLLKHKSISQSYGNDLNGYQDEY